MNSREGGLVGGNCTYDDYDDGHHPRMKIWERYFCMKWRIPTEAEREIIMRPTTFAISAMVLKSKF
jgi:hypothetical protein